MPRVVALWSVFFVGCAAAAAPTPAEARRARRPRGIQWDERPVDVLVAEAARTRKRVIVDFWAEW